MRVTNPVDVTNEGRLTSSSVQEPDLVYGEEVWEFRPAPEPYEFYIDAGQDVRQSSLYGMAINGGTNELFLLSILDDGSIDKRLPVYDFRTGYRKGVSPRDVTRGDSLTARNSESGALDSQNIIFIGQKSSRSYRIHRYINNVLTYIYLDTFKNVSYMDFTCAEVGGVYAFYLLSMNHDDNNSLYITKMNYNTGAEEAFIKIGVGPDGQSPKELIAIDYYNGEFYFVSGSFKDHSVWRFTTSLAFVDIVHVFESDANSIPCICNDGEGFYFANTVNSYAWPKGEVRTYDVATFNRILITPPPDVDPYQIGDRVILLDTHKLYEATAENRDNPSAGVGLVPPTWVEVSATNRYRAFDESITTATTGGSPLTFEIKPGQVFDSFVGFNIKGARTVNATVTDPVDGVVYTRVVSLVDNSAIADWYSYLWNGFSLKSDFALFDLPLFSNASVTVEFIGDGEISVGALVTGPSIVLGQAVHGTSIQQLDFSTIDEDDFGNLNITKRPGAKLVNYDVSTQKSQLNYVYRALEKLSGVATVWSGTDSIQDETLVYGYHRDNNITLDTPTLCQVTIQVRGLI